MEIRWHHGCILMGVKRRNLPGAAAGSAEPPAALAQPWIAEVARTLLTGTVPSTDAAKGRYSIEHGLPELPGSAVPCVPIICQVASNNAIERSQPPHLDHHTFARTVRQAFPLGNEPLDAATSNDSHAIWSALHPSRNYRPYGRG